MEFSFCGARLEEPIMSRKDLDNVPQPYHIFSLAAGAASLKARVFLRATNCGLRVFDASFETT
jgi:hypothetical protein